MWRYVLLILHPPPLQRAVKVLFPATLISSVPTAPAMTSTVFPEETIVYLATRPFTLTCT